MSTSSRELFLDKPGLRTLKEEIQLMIKRELGDTEQFELIDTPSIAELPNVGSTKALYIVRNPLHGDAIYRWDQETLTYGIVGTNYTNIKIIRGGNANE